jgi:hypothetical protein
VNVSIDAIFIDFLLCSGQRCPVTSGYYGVDAQIFDNRRARARTSRALSPGR